MIRFEAKKSIYARSTSIEKQIGSNNTHRNKAAWCTNRQQPVDLLITGVLPVNTIMLIAAVLAVAATLRSCSCSPRPPPPHWNSCSSSSCCMTRSRSPSLGRGAHDRGADSRNNHCRDQEPPANHTKNSFFNTGG